MTIAHAQESQAWEPSPPPIDRFDWIQLTSGEWLKGELKGLYERELEFDSDKMDLQQFDWDDVKHVRCPRLFSVRLAGPVTVVGTLEIDEQQVIVVLGENKRVFNRYQLIALAPAGKKERDNWSGKMSFGFNISRGNSDQIQYNARATLERRTSETRLTLDYFGNITETKDIETENNQRVHLQYDLFKTQKYYFRPIFGEYYRDPFKNIGYKITVGTGMGYYFINTPKTQWEIAGGPGYQATRFDSVETGQNTKESTPALIAGTSFDTELTDDIDFSFNYTFQILDEVSGTFTQHAVTTFGLDLTDIIDFDVSFIWDRVKDPKANNDGTVPEKDDFYMILGIGIDF